MQKVAALSMARPMLQAVFWDNDGVLVDTEELFFDVTRAVLARVGVALSQEQFTALVLREGRSVFELAGEGLDAAAVDRLRIERDTRYAERLAGGVSALEGVEAVLASLQRRVALAVVTSSSPDHFQIMHRTTGLLRYFAFVLTNRDYAHTKPHPAPYLAALARSGLAPEQCIAIEDSERGLAAARAAGLRCIVVPRGLTRGGDFRDAYRVLEEVREVPVVLAPLMEA